MALATLGPDLFRTPPPQRAKSTLAPSPLDRLGVGAGSDAGPAAGPGLAGALHAAGLHLVVPPHSVLFVQGDEAAGVHVLHSGQVKLTMNSRRGRTLILKVCEAGEVLGLHNCLAVGSGQWPVVSGEGAPGTPYDHPSAPNTGAPGTPYEASAESLQRSEITFVRRDDFLRLLAREPQVLYAVAEQLSRECHAAYGLIHSLATSNCISERLARLLLDLAEVGGRRSATPWRPSASLGTGCARAGDPGSTADPALPPAVDCRPSTVAVGLTHEEIAQMIGTSRETVTRLLKEFRTRKLATLKGSTLHILDKLALQQMAAQAQGFGL